MSVIKAAASPRITTERVQLVNRFNHYANVRSMSKLALKNPGNIDAEFNNITTRAIRLLSPVEKAISAERTRPLISMLNKKRSEIVGKVGTAQWAALETLTKYGFIQRNELPQYGISI